jgi:hypothetical protein
MISSENHELPEDKYAPTYRREVNRSRIFRNTTRNISRRLIITTASISLIPLTEQLNKLNTAYEEHTINTKIPHLLYMDNLKLIEKTEEELQKQKQVVRNFSEDIHMEFGLHRCTNIVMKRGKLVHSQNLILDFNREIQGLEQGKT